MKGTAIVDEDLENVLRRTVSLWDELRGKRLFITGGTGFFGRWILESFAYANRLLDLKASAVVLSRDPHSFHLGCPHLSEEGSIRIHQGDIADFSFPDGDFSHVIHAASELSSANPVNPVGMLHTTLEGARRVCDFAAARHVSKLLFTSSGAVYGNTRLGRASFSEEDMMGPLELSAGGAYSEAKRLAELICCIRGQQSGFETKIARGFAFIGPFIPLNLPLAAPSFIKNAINSQAITISGHGQNLRSYLYGADLAIWIWTILFVGGSARPYNLGSDYPVSIQNLAETIRAMTPGAGAVRILSSLSDNEEIERYVPNIRRSANELGLAVYTPFQEAVRRTLEFYR
jgi:nucleoside-diphosphate-sugar epimerase